MTLAELSRNTSFRLAAMFVALFSGAMIIAFMLVYWQAGRFLDQHLVDRLSETRDALLIVANRDGVEGLRNVVQSEAATVRDADTIFQLSDLSGNFIAGNAEHIQPFSGLRRIPRAAIPEMASRAAYDDQFVSEWSNFEGGTLLVGVSDRGVQATREFILKGLGWGLAGMLALACMSGLWLASTAQDRVDAFAKTLSDISRGKLDQRVPLTGLNDDLDQVGRQLNAALDRLSRLIERMNQSASAIAHELRSPIGRVRQKLERLIEHPTGGPSPESTAREALSEVEQIVEIIDAILRIGQIQAGARKDRFTHINLASLMIDVAEVYDPVAEEAGMSIVCPPVIGPKIVMGDQPLLTQLFANLIENSVRHCGPGTTIELSLDEAEDGPTVRVADTGPGIPASERQRVLEPFARLDKSRTTPGAGLGLSLVAAIAELHGARLVLSDNGPGLAVMLDFPAVAEAP